MIPALLFVNLPLVQASVFVAMRAMHVMELTVHQVVGVIAVRDRFVTARWAVFVTIRVIYRVFLGRIFGIDGKLVLHVRAFFCSVQVAVMQVVDMTIMLHCSMPATFAMLVGMIAMSSLFMSCRLGCRGEGGTGCDT